MESRYMQYIIKLHFYDFASCCKKIFLYCDELVEATKDNSLDTIEVEKIIYSHYDCKRKHI